MAEYYKLSGAGNDFLALVEPRRQPTRSEIGAWCRRGLSIGADGMILLARTGGGARMAYFNADGSRGALCLNGCRCAARLAFELAWGSGAITVETDCGAILAREIDRGRIELELPPILGEPERASLAVGDRRHDGWKMRVGVPHFVLPWPDGLSEAPVGELGRLLRAHPDLGPEGANIDFVRFVDGGSFEIRSYERGVEAETLACGTGAVAAAAAGVAAGRLEPPIAALTAGGCELWVGGEAEGGRLRRATLAGDARTVTRGEILPGASSVPPRPAWS